MSNAFYSRRRYRRVADGTWLFPVPVGAVIDHVDDLRASGMTYADIAAEAQVAERTVRGLGQHRTVRGATATAILAVAARPVGPRLPSNLVPGLRSARQVQALAAIGWPLADQARRMGMHPKTAWTISRAATGYVTADTRSRVDVLFDQLSATVGPSLSARRTAARNGWLPPLAWDDLDDPEAAPSLGESADDFVDEVAIERALAGRHLDLTDAELVAVLQTGVARGEPLSKLAERVGINYFGARKMLGGELTPRRAKQAEIEAHLLRAPDQPDSMIGALLGVHHQTVTRARARLAKRSAA